MIFWGDWKASIDEIGENLQAIGDLHLWDADTSLLFRQLMLYEGTPICSQYAALDAGSHSTTETEVADIEVTLVHCITQNENGSLTINCRSKFG